jgi:hypothetical protein
MKKGVVKVENSKKRTIITDTLIISSVPILCYIVNYIYNAGRFFFYKLPIEIIPNGITNLLSSTSLFVALILGMTYVIFELVDLNDHPNRSMYLRSNFIIVFIVWIIVDWIFKTDYIFLLILAFFLILLAISFFIPFGKRKDVKYLAYLTDLDSQIFNPRKVDSARISSKSHARLLFFIEGCLILFLIFFNFYAHGYNDAQKQKIYYVVNGQQEQIVLIFSDNRAIVSNYYREKNLAGSTFMIINLNESEFQYHSENIGPIIMGDHP